MSLLLTDNASPGSSDGMMPGFLVGGRGEGSSRAILATARPSLLLLVSKSTQQYLVRSLMWKSHGRGLSIVNLHCRGLTPRGSGILFTWASV